MPTLSMFEIFGRIRNHGQKFPQCSQTSFNGIYMYKHVETFVHTGWFQMCTNFSLSSLEMQKWKVLETVNLKQQVGGRQIFGKSLLSSRPNCRQTAGDSYLNTYPTILSHTSHKFIFQNTLRLNSYWIWGPTRLWTEAILKIKILHNLTLFYLGI